MKLHLVPSIVRLALAGSLLLAGLVAFHAYQVTDETIPHGYSRALTIMRVDGSLTDGDALRLLESVAAIEHLNLAKDVRVEGRGGERRILYTFAGDEKLFSNEFPDGRYPAFGPGMTTTLEPSAAVTGHDLRGLYFADSDAATVVRAIEALKEGGIEAADEPIEFGYIWQRVSDELGLMPIGTAVVIFLVLACASAGVRMQKSRALLLLHGRSEWRSALSELGAILALGAGISVGIVALAVCCLIPLNGLAQFSEFAAWLAVALAVTSFACVACHLLMFLLMPVPLPLHAIRGKRPTLFVASVAAICQSSALILVLVSVSSFLAAGVAAQASFNAVDRWTRAPDLVGTRASMELATEPQGELAIRFGRMYDGVQARRGSLLAYGVPGATRADGFAPYSGNSIVANPEFLDREIIRGEDGRRIQADDIDPGAITVLIPADMKPNTMEITKEYREFGTFQRSLEGESENLPPARVVNITTRSGQEVFNFSDGSLGSVTQLDPVVAIFPYSGHYLSMNFYLASASTQNLLFVDARTTREQINAQSLGGLLVGVFRPAEKALQVASAANRAVRTLASASAVSGACLLITSLFLAYAYSDMRRTIIFIRRVHGWSFVDVNKTFLGLAAAATFLILLMLDQLGFLAAPALPFGIALCTASVATLCVTVLLTQPRLFTNW